MIRLLSCPSRPMKRLDVLCLFDRKTRARIFIITDITDIYESLYQFFRNGFAVKVCGKEADLRSPYKKKRVIIKVKQIREVFMNIVFPESGRPSEARDSARPCLPSWPKELSKQVVHALNGLAWTGTSLPRNFINPWERRPNVNGSSSAQKARHSEKWEMPRQSDDPCGWSNGFADSCTNYGRLLFCSICSTSSFRYSQRLIKVSYSIVTASISAVSSRNRI